MAKYKKTYFPNAVVEAFKYDGDFTYSNGDPYVPSWAFEALDTSDLAFKGQGELFSCNGNSVEVGDYIVKGILGEVYAQKPDKFEQFHEIAEPIAKINIDMTTEFPLELSALEASVLVTVLDAVKTGERLENVAPEMVDKLILKLTSHALNVCYEVVK